MSETRLSLAWLKISKRTSAVMFFAFILSCPATAKAQLVPEIGYVHPAGVKAGTTTDVVLGGYDWTPDMQLFVHHPGVKLELIGPPTEVLVPEKPYWFGFKARGAAWPLPREFRARVTVAPDVVPGVIKWQVANANGASPVGMLHVSGVAEVSEDAARKTAQALPALPVVVSGQIRRIEEIDRYSFTVAKDGPITIQTIARQLGSPLHVMMQVRDLEGRLILDVADTEGRDLTRTFFAKAGVAYEISLHDLDYAGDRSYVYRLMLSDGPNILAAYPAAGRRGQTQSVEFVGFGLESGTDKLESVRRDVAFPAEATLSEMAYVLETPFGKSRPFKLEISDWNESVRPATGDSILTAPTSVTGFVSSRFGTDTHQIVLKKGDAFRFVAQARAIGSPLDVELTLFGPDGKQVATSDDATGSTDSEFLFTAVADGNHRLDVTDRSGKSGSRGANYRLTIAPPKENATFAMPALLPIPLGTTVKLAIKATREGGFKGAIPLKLEGLPIGVTAAGELAIAENKNDASIDLVCAADAPANAALCQITATLPLASGPVTRDVGNILLAVTMKPRIKLTPEGLDDVRKVHRGSTYLAPVLIERLEGFAGPITLEMTSKQQRHRQGLSSDEFTVPPDAKRVEYPIFIPEWMETTKTSRMILNGSVQVADPKGNVRTLLQRQELRIGILPEGAMMKLSHSAGEVRVANGAEITIPITLARVAEFSAPVQVELVVDDESAGNFMADPITLTPDQSRGTITLRMTKDTKFTGERTLTLRAKGLKDGRWPVIAETSVLVNVR